MNKKFGDYFNNERSSDSVILLKNPYDIHEPYVYYVHKLVLVSNSDYFKTLIMGGFMEKNSSTVRDPSCSFF